MRRLTSLAVVVSVLGLLVLLSVPAFAQSARLRANIPFQFRAGDHVFPAGNYIVEVEPMYHRLAVLSKDTTSVLVLSAHTVTRSAEPERAMLVFKRYGDSYFLRQAWAPAAGMGAQLPATKAEREMAKAAAGTRVATVPVWSK